MPKFCCVSFSGELCSLAFPSDGKVAQESAILSDDLKSIVKKHKLAAVDTIGILSGTDYQLLKTKRPEVSVPELKEALLWQEQARLSIPANQIIIDYFDCHSASDANDIYVVAVDKTILEQRFRILQMAEFRVTKLTIPELIYVECFEQMKNDMRPTIWLNLFSDSAQALFLRDGDLVATIRLPKATADNSDDALIKAVTLFYYDLKKNYGDDISWVVNGRDQSLGERLVERLPGKVELLAVCDQSQATMMDSHAVFGVLANAQ